MKHCLSFLCSLLVVTCSLLTVSCSLHAQATEVNVNNSVDFAMSMGIGWNLGNQMDAHINGVAVESSWGNQPATEYTFRAIAKAGFTSVRIPITWMGHIGPAPTYTLDKGWLDRVEELVLWAKKYNLKVIINIHHDGFGAGFIINKITWER